MAGLLILPPSCRRPCSNDATVARSAMRVHRPGDAGAGLSRNRRRPDTILKIVESSMHAIGRTIDPRDWRKILPFKTAASSDGLGWVGLQAARCREEPAFELSVPALSHHRLVFVARPSDDL